MAVNIKVFPGAELTDQEFALILSRLTPGQSGVIYGARASILETAANTVQFTAGWVLVRGRLITMDKTNVSVPLPTSGSVDYIIALKVSLSNEDNPVEIIVTEKLIADTSTFNVTKGTAYYPLATVTASTKGLSNVKSTYQMSRRPYIRTGTSTPSDSTGEDGDIYIQYKK